jgi:hypothetical protein
MVGVSVSVEQQRVQDEVRRRGPGAFLLTVTDDGRPHVVAVTVDWDGASLVMAAGRSSVGNATARSGVSLLWPPSEPGGYSLIVDGEATTAGSATGGGRVSVRPVKAVLHRPGSAGGPEAPASGEACGSDCIPILRS